METNKKSERLTSSEIEQLFEEIIAYAEEGIAQRATQANGSTNESEQDKPGEAKDGDKKEQNDQK